MKQEAERHIIAVGYNYRDQDDEDIADDLTCRLNSGELTVANLAEGDVIRTKESSHDPDIWYRNDGLFFVYRTNPVEIIPPSYDFDDYGHVPSILFWPKFPSHYWVNVVDHNNIVPIRFPSLNIMIESNDVKMKKLVDDLIDITFAYIEDEDVMIIHYSPVKGALNQEKILDDIRTAQYAHVVMSDDTPAPFANWEISQVSCGTSKTILVLLNPEDNERNS